VNRDVIVRVRHLSHRFGTVQALSDVTFEVERGSILGLFGPPAAGKTTALRALATLVAPTGGRIEVAGIDAAREPERVRQRVGFVGDRAGIYAELTVEEYLGFFAAAYRLEVPASIDRALERTRLSERRRDRTSALAPGSRQRMHIARALLHDPELLLLDDPAAPLEAGAKDEVLALLGELRAAGKTVVLTSRILADLAGRCTAIALLKKGQLVSLDHGPRAAEKMPAETPAPTEAP
jgi:ABC-2 type transport system ATP-binding protein